MGHARRARAADGAASSSDRAERPTNGVLDAKTLEVAATSAAVERDSRRTVRGGGRRRPRPTCADSRSGRNTCAASRLRGRARRELPPADHLRIEPERVAARRHVRGVAVEVQEVGIVESRLAAPSRESAESGLDEIAATPRYSGRARCAASSAWLRGLVGPRAAAASARSSGAELLRARSANAARTASTFSTLCGNSCDFVATMRRGPARPRRCSTARRRRSRRRDPRADSRPSAAAGSRRAARRGRGERRPRPASSAGRSCESRTETPCRA